MSKFIFQYTLKNMKIKKKKYIIFIIVFYNYGYDFMYGRNS